VASIIFNKTDLLHALSELSNVIPKKSADYPVCKFVAVTFREDSIVLTGSNTFVQISIKVPAKFVKQPDNFLFHFDKIHSILKRCTESQKITFNLSNEKQIGVHLDSVKAKYRINTMPYSEFIWLQSDKLEHKTTLPCSAVHKSLIKISHATAKETNAKAQLKGIHLTLKNGELETMTTDGHRMALFLSVMEDEQATLENKVVIPVEAGEMVSKICATHQDDSIILGFNSSSFKAVVNNLQVVFRLQYAIYPELKKVIGREATHSVTFDRLEILRALKTLNTIVMDDRFKRCTFNISKSSILLSAENASKDKGEIEIPISGGGVDMEICINHTYMIDAIASFDGENVHMGFSDPQEFVKLTDNNDESHINVVMPLR